jgi:hypothetical protein
MLSWISHFDICCVHLSISTTSKTYTDKFTKIDSLGLEVSQHPQCALLIVVRTSWMHCAQVLSGFAMGLLPLLFLCSRSELKAPASKELAPVTLCLLALTGGLDFFCTSASPWSPISRESWLFPRKSGDINPCVIHLASYDGCEQVRNEKKDCNITWIDTVILRTSVPF